VLDNTGSDACAKVQEQLLKAWNVIEPNSEAFGSTLFRWMKLVYTAVVSGDHLINYL